MAKKLWRNEHKNVKKACGQRPSPKRRTPVKSVSGERVTKKAEVMYWPEETALYDLFMWNRARNRFPQLGQAWRPNILRSFNIGRLTCR
jgi:hypothetical protein